MRPGNHADDLFDLSVDMLCVAGMDGYFQVLNPAFERTLGYPPEELKRRPFLEFVHPDDRAATIAEVEKLKTGAVTIRFENRYRCKDGTYKWLSWTSRPDVRRGLLFAVARDVTEEKAREERLRRAEAATRHSKGRLEREYESVVRASGQLLYFWDPATNQATYRNCETALGYRDEELAGDLARWTDLIHPDDRDRFLREVDRAVAAGTHFTLDYRVRRKDGATIHVVDRGYFSRAPDGTLSALVGFVVDVSDRKALEDQLRQAQKMEAIGRLAGGVAHDFNNLLTVILGYTALALKKMSAVDPLRGDLQEVLRAGERAQGLTQQLLAFSRKQILKPRVLDLNAAVRGVESLLRRVIGEDVELRIKPGAALHPVEADPGQLEQVLLNLAVNARDAMPKGGTLTIETTNATLDEEYARLHPGSRTGPHVLLAVSDTGTGMDAATQARLFEPFFTTKGPGKGTGLGLSTVYGIVKQSGGNVWVYSEPGRGATFKVYLPRAEAGAAAPAPAREEKPPSPRGEGKILVVEDEEGVRRFVERVLAAEGYTVLAAADADGAAELARRHGACVDLLLTDVVLKGASGPDVAATLTALCPRSKVLFMSGYTEDAVLRHGVQHAEVEFLEKPLTVDGLLDKVREVLAGPGGGRP